ncbi:hypothetical protein [Streptomyces melanogenes]|uniref:hypothetical protein n=1 Tax=Streptomyces melanogenes TaxID=67326 RepID=UPI00378BE8E0
MRQRHRRASSALAALTVLALAGCSGTDSGPAVASSPPAAPPGTSAQPPASNDPATWDLPLIRYQPTTEQARTIRQARETLIEQCARRYGITLTPDPELPPLGPKNQMDWRYGIHERDLTERRGYQVDDKQQARYDAALQAQSSRPRPPRDTPVVVNGTKLPPEALAATSADAQKGIVAGKPVPDGGCSGEANRALGTSTQGFAPLVDRLMNASYPQSMKEPDVKDVFARWSACMRARGFSYSAPMDANDDPAFRASPSGVSRHEIDTALADLDCRTTHRVAEVWHGAEARIQAHAVTENASDLATARRDLDHTVAVAQRITASTH